MGVRSRPRVGALVDVRQGTVIPRDSRYPLLFNCRKQLDDLHGG